MTLGRSSECRSRFKLNLFVFTACSRGYFLSCSLVFFDCTTTVSSMAIVVSALSRDRIRYSSIESLSDSSLPRANPDIDLTLQRLRKVRSTIVSTNSSPNSSSNFDNSVFAANNTDFSSYSSSNSNT
ncbi:hypothetical protein CR513_20123, partial [Mucuna pruriens]